MTLRPVGGVPRKWFDAEATVSPATTSAARDFDDPTERRRWLRTLSGAGQKQCSKEGNGLRPDAGICRETLWKDGRCAVTGRSFSLQPFPDALVKYPFAPSIDRKPRRAAAILQRQCAARLCRRELRHGAMGTRGIPGACPCGCRPRTASAARVHIHGGMGSRLSRRAHRGGPGGARRSANQRAKLKQRQRIAGLKRALTLGPDGLRAAAAKAKASRKPASPPSRLGPALNPAGRAMPSAAISVVGLLLRVCWPSPGRASRRGFRWRACAGSRLPGYRPWQVIVAISPPCFTPFSMICLT